MAKQYDPYGFEEEEDDPFAPPWEDPREEPPPEEMAEPEPEPEPERETSAPSDDGDDWYDPWGDVQGHLEGVGETIAPGRSTTQAQANQAVQQVRNWGASDEWIQNFLTANPYDYSRMAANFLDEFVTEMGDSNDPRTANKPADPDVDLGDYRVVELPNRYVPQDQRGGPVGGISAGPPNTSTFSGWYDPYGAQQGWLDAIGETIAPGRSTTQAQADQAVAQVRALGASDEWIQNFLTQNPYDYGRMWANWMDQFIEMGDSNDPRTQNRPLDTTPSGGGGGGGGGGSFPTEPGGGPGTAPPTELPEHPPGWTGVPPEETPTTPTTEPPKAPTEAELALKALIDQLQNDRTLQATERAELRKILMGQLGELDDPVSTDDPGLREAIAANRIGLQRGTEAQRREIAERRAYDESGGMGSGAYQNDVDRLLQEQGEAGADFEGQVVFKEMQDRRMQLQSLLAQAMAAGDAETARAIQLQLTAIGAQLEQSNFYDTLGFDYTELEQRMNALLMQLIAGGGNVTV